MLCDSLTCRAVGQARPARPAPSMVTAVAIASCKPRIFGRVASACPTLGDPDPATTPPSSPLPLSGGGSGKGRQHRKNPALSKPSKIRMVLIPTALEIDFCPFSGRDRGYGCGAAREEVPGCGALVEAFGVAVEDGVGELVGAQVLPDVCNRGEFGRIVPAPDPIRGRESE